MTVRRLDPLGSRIINSCQNCGASELHATLFLGYVPPVNTMLDIDSPADVEMRFPLAMLRCPECTLVQVGYQVDPEILFPHSYPYLSGSTRILRENFADLAAESKQVLSLGDDDLVIDVGANDGTLLTPFKENGQNVLGIEPSQAADVAAQRGIPVMKRYFNQQVAQEAREKHGPARVVTAANVFAHIPDVHGIVNAIKHLLTEDGVFISESHYLLDLVEGLQYDTVYHEHLRYYSLGSLVDIFKRNGLEVFRIKRIPSHGGSIRVYSAKEGQRQIDPSVQECLDAEARAGITDGSALDTFATRVAQSKLGLLKLLAEIKHGGARVYGIGAPSRASTLINYVGLDDGIIDCVLEISASHKLNKYIPGTRLPVLDEKKLFDDQPEYALLLSWHIGEELADILKRKGFEGKFIMPLPTPAII